MNATVCVNKLPFLASRNSQAFHIEFEKKRRDTRMKVARFFSKDLYYATFNLDVLREMRGRRE